jgi:hypothetical protein
LLLLKRTSGKPLSEAELRQRRNAARARWAAAGVGGGAVAGGLFEAARAGVWSAAAAERAARETALRGVRAARNARTLEVARMTDIREAIERDFARQMGQTPGGGPPRSVQDTAQSLRVRTPETVQNRILAENMTRRAAGLPIMTVEEQAARFAELMAGVRQPTSLRVSTTERPIVGNIENKLVYARQLWRAGRRLRLAEHWDASVAREAAAAGEDPAFFPSPREARTRLATLASIRKEIADLKTLQEKAFQPTARAGGPRAETTRRGRRGEKTPVKGTKVRTSVVRQARGGEKIEDLRARVAKERADTRAERELTLERHGRRTARMVARAERHAIDQTTEAVRQAYTTGEIASRILRRAGRGALIGAVAGLTTAGVAALAQSAITIGVRSRNPPTSISSSRWPRRRRRRTRQRSAWRASIAAGSIACSAATSARWIWETASSRRWARTSPRPTPKG